MDPSDSRPIPRPSRISNGAYNILNGYGRDAVARVDYSSLASEYREWLGVDALFERPKEEYRTLRESFKEFSDTGSTRINSFIALHMSRNNLYVWGRTNVSSFKLMAKINRSVMTLNSKNSRPLASLARKLAEREGLRIEYSKGIKVVSDGWNIAAYDWRNAPEIDDSNILVSTMNDGEIEPTGEVYFPSVDIPF